MVVFGGRKAPKEITEEVLVLDLEEAHWSQLAFGGAQGPCARVKASFVAAFPTEFTGNKHITLFNYNKYIEQKDAHSGLYLFGGLSHGKKALNDLWVLRNSLLGFV